MFIILFLQEAHSDYKTQLNWDRDWPGLTFISHGTTHSAGVIIHIGKKLKFKMTAKIITVLIIYFVRNQRKFNLFLQTQLRWNQRKPVKSNGLSRVLKG